MYGSPFQELTNEKKNDIIFRTFFYAMRIDTIIAYSLASISRISCLL